ncbi:MAG: ABC transporter substrate-binding protein [Clostridia bacterium]|nr:ABC transporter substrate-binding protein [Clostridia bacterium]
MWNKRFWANALIILLLIACLGGCSAPAESPAEGGIVFTDALDRQVRLPAPPKRVAALLGSFADIWMLAGGAICAAAEDAWEDFGLELPDAVNLGGAHSPSAEALLAAEPDFVLASASTASNVALLELLEQAGIAVAYFDVDNFEDYLAMLKLCTAITDRADLYAQNGTRLQAQIEAIREQVNSAALSQKERTVLLLRASSGSVKAKGSEGTVLGEMLADLGCINIADSDQTLLETLSAEAVMKQEPHRIFVVSMGDEQKAAESLARMMAENPAWGSLEAVKQHRLHLMDRKLFNLKPNAKWATSYEQLSKLLLAN